MRNALQLLAIAALMVLAAGIDSIYDAVAGIPGADDGSVACTDLGDPDGCAP